MSYTRLFMTSLLLAGLIGCGGGAGFTEWSDPSTDPWGSDEDDSPAPADDDDAADQGDDDDAADEGDDDDTVASDDDDSISADDDDDGLYEGDDPGECTDGADNDLDGWFDCDDAGCFGSPDCEGEAGDDDDDDDDATPPPGDDDDDDGGGPGAPALTSVTTVWNGGTGEFEFTLYMSDGDCDLGLPTIYWSVDGADQSPLALTGTPLSCSGTVYFYVGGLTPGSTYTFGFWIDDDAGNLSAPYTTTVTAS